MTRRHTPQRPYLRDILPHLQRVREQPDGSYMASCPLPTHGKGRGDIHPSLQLWENPDGTLAGAKCYAGCDGRELWRKLLELGGVRPATARPIAPRRNRQQPATAQAQPLTLVALADAKQLDAEKLIAWHVRELPDGGIEILYLTREGELHAVQYRYALEGDNRFKWRKDDTPILYGLWRLCEWTDSDTLYLCEGVSDTWTLWHADLPALGIPSASTWKSEWWREVEGFERIVLIADADKAGKDLAKTLAKTCPDSLRERVQVLQLPEGVKDANELWQQVDADPERFKEALNLATWQPLKELPTCQVANLPETDDLPLLAPLSELLSSDAEHELEYVPLLGVDGIIARGTITLLGAHPKAGKTTLLIHACREWLQQGLRVVYLSEDTRAIWRERVKRFPELGALILNAIPRAHPENWARAVRELEPDIVIVDTIRRFMPAKDENDSASVSLALMPFVDLQQELPRTAIVLVHHTKKSLSSDGEITDIAGSHAFTAEVDAILLLAPVKEQKRQRVLTPIAGRLWTLSPEPLVLELSEDGSEYRVVGTAEEVLPETHAQSTREKVLQAIRVLGQATRNEIEEYLREIGEKIPERTIRDALQRLYEDGKVERERVGRGGAFTYRVAEVGNLATWQPLNNLPTCQLREAAQVDASTLFTLAAERGYPALVVEYPDGKARFHIAGTREGWELALPELERENLLQSAYHALLEPSDAPTAEPLPDLPAVFQNRTPFESCIPADLLQAWLPQGIADADLDAVQVMLAYAEARGFPALVVDGYTIHGDLAGWLTAAGQLAGKPAVRTATRLLHALDAGGTPHAPTHNTLLRNGDAGATPSQLPLLEG
jgi:DNA-binding transcriptional ArsR family regulator